MGDTKDKKMLCRIVYMIYAKKVIEILEQQKRIRFNDEMKRKFLIGVLISIDKRFEEYGDGLFNITKNGFLGSKLFFLRTNPFVLGCLLGYVPDKGMSTDEIWKNLTKTSDDNCIKVAKRLWLRFNLKVEDFQLFLSPIDSFSPSKYNTIYYEICEYIKQMNKVTTADIEAESIKSIAVKYEEACFKYAEFFYKKRLRFVWKWEFWLGQKIPFKKQNENKWSADVIKMDYYEKRWSEICQKADMQNDKQLATFFAGLRKEIEDVSARSKDMLKNRNEEQHKIIWFLFGATFFNAITVGSTGICDFVFEAENMAFGWQIMMKVIPVAFASLATMFSALLTANNLLKEHHAYEETWLRHQLNLSRLTGELEKFCEGLDGYSGINGTNEKQIHKAISKFQKNIYLLRKQDYANFFSNMNCINYDPDYKLNDN